MDLLSGLCLARFTAGLITNGSGREQKLNTFNVNVSGSINFLSTVISVAKRDVWWLKVDFDGSTPNVFKQNP